MPYQGLPGGSPFSFRVDLPLPWSNAVPVIAVKGPTTAEACSGSGLVADFDAELEKGPVQSPVQNQ